MKDTTLITRAIERSGLSNDHFAEWIVGVDERTVRRWVNGQKAINATRRAWLEQWLQLDSKTVAAIVAAMSRL
jgi:hypothetical protein